MAKKKRNLNVDAAEPPMSAMIDVVFLLLIYFISTQKEIIPEAHLAINLPSPNPGPPPETQQIPMDILVLPGPNYQVSGAPATLEVIDARLRSVAGINIETTVTVKTSMRAKADDMVKVLDLCHKYGLKNLNVVTYNY